MDYTYFWQNMHFPLDSIQSVLLKPAIAVSRISNMQTITLGFSTVFATIYIYICQQFCTGQETQKLWMFLIGPRFSLARKQPTLRSTGRSCWSGKIAYGFFMFFPLKPIYGEEPKYWFCACVCVFWPLPPFWSFFLQIVLQSIYIYILIQFMFDRLRIIAWTLTNCSVEWSKHNTGKCR